MPIHWIKKSPAVAGGGIALVQSNAGNTATSTPTSLSATLPGTPTSGNTLILIVSSDATVSTPAGWTVDKSQINNNGHYLFRKTSAGTETSVTVNPTVGASTSWNYMEYSGMHASPLAVTTSAGSGTGISSLATGTTGTSSGATGGIAIASWGQSIIASGATATTDSYTAGFVELHDTCTTKASGTNVTCATATVAVAADGTFTSTATFSAANAATGIIAVYKKA